MIESNPNGRASLVSRVILVVLITVGSASPAATQHGDASATESGAVPPAAALHAQFFADPRLYRLSDGSTLIVGPASMPGAARPQIKALHPRSGQIIDLQSTAMDRLESAGGHAVRLKEHGKITEWQSGNAMLSGGLDEDFTSDPVNFRNGEVSLAGRLTRKAQGQAPAIVLAHGGGATDRNSAYFALLAAHFADQGFAVLTYDKRGLGKSTGGSWRAPVAVLGTDLSAAVRYLTTRKDIDPNRIGVIGLSQGGWLGPLASAETGAVAFLALLSAPPVDTWEQELNEANSDLAARKFNDTEREAAMNAMRLLLESLKLGSPTPELQRAVAGSRHEPWFKVVELDDRQGYIDELRRNHFDPAAVLGKLTTPIFLAFGADDLITPHRQYVPIWRETLGKAGAKDVTITVYPEANHGILRGPLGGTDAPFAPEFLPALTGWLKQQAGLDSHPGQSSELTAPQAKAMPMPAAKQAAGLVSRTGTPPIDVRVLANATYLGVERFELFDVADCEIHLFVEADEGGRVKRIYWVQFEEYLPHLPERSCQEVCNRDQAAASFFDLMTRTPSTYFAPCATSASSAG